MPNIKITWPKDQNGDDFSILDWVATLSAQEQLEWNTAASIHDKMVDAAVAAGDAVKLKNNVQWKDTLVWQGYIERYLTEDVKLVEKKYWDRYLQHFGLSMSDVVRDK